MTNKVKLGIKVYSISNDIYEFSTEELPITNNCVDVDNITSKFLYDFFSVFSSENKKISDSQINIEFQAFISYNKNLKEKLNNFINNYTTLCPKLNALRKFFVNIQNNEYICVLPAYEDIDTKKEIEITKNLRM